MDFLSNISLILNYTTFGLILGSTIVGVLIGALPGLSSGMAIALLLPFTIYLEPSQAIAAMAALYCGGTFGGSITAILINAQEHHQLLLLHLMVFQWHKKVKLEEL